MRGPVRLEKYTLARLSGSAQRGFKNAILLISEA